MNRLPVESSAKEEARELLSPKIRQEDDSFLTWIETCKKNRWEHPFGKDEQEAFQELQYEPDLKSPLLSCEFVLGAVNVCDENRGKWLPPGILCSKVIDFCERERKRDKALGADGGYYYPPDFVDHRNRLREKNG